MNLISYQTNINKIDLCVNEGSPSIKNYVEIGQGLSTKGPLFPISDISYD